MIPDPILLSPEPFPLSPDPSPILGFEPWAHIPCYDPGSVEDYSPSQSPTKTSYICRLELENSVFLHLVLLRFIPVASNSFSFPSLRSSYTAATLSSTCFWIFLPSRIQSGEETDIGRQRLNYSPIFRTKQVAWHKRIQLNYKLSTTYPRLAIFSLRELHQRARLLWGLKQVFVPIWSPWEPNLSNRRRGCQLGLLSIIFQPIVFPFVWAKYKWNFIRDRCKLSFPLPLAASPLARAFSRDSPRSPNRRACSQAKRDWERSK